MAGGVAETLRDTDPLFQGTQKCRTWLLKTVNDPADFVSCGAKIGLAVKNLTDGSSGHVESVTENSFDCTLTGGANNVWAKGDVYQIFKTATYGSVISTHYNDRRYGHKFVNPDELVDGIKADEIDVDEHERNVFSPDQPSTNKRGW